MPIWNNFPYSNTHELNLDYIIEEQGKQEKRFTEVIDIATEKAETATTAAETATGAAETATTAAESASEDAASLAGKAAQVDVNTARIDNILVQGTPTEGNAELIDIRVGQNGVTYQTAGDAVRGQYNQSVNSYPTLINTEALKVAPYDDLDTVPTNQIINFSGAGLPAHLPREQTTGGISVLTLSRSNVKNKTSITVQHAVSRISSSDIKYFFRMAYGAGGTYDPWQELPTLNEVNSIHASSVKGSGLIFNANNPMVAPYDDLNFIPFNNIITYTAPAGYPLHVPSSVDAANVSGFTIVTLSRSTNENYNSVPIQLLMARRREGGVSMYVRTAWEMAYETARWTDWYQLTDTANDTPKITPEMFSKIAVIGDSFSAGVRTDTGRDYSNSWLQMICRKYGCTGENYATGGLTTRTWLTSQYGLAKLQQDTEVYNLYFIALGINDSNPDSRNVPIGDIADYSTETDTPDTFYGNMGRIYRAVKAKNPNAAICYITPQRIGDRYTPYQEAVADMAQASGCLLIKSEDVAILDTSWWNNNLVSLHPTIPMYSALANSIVDSLSESIRNNMSYLSNYPTVS